MPYRQRMLDQLRRALTDRYDVDREIGAGGMATVFLAQDRRHGRRVAIKVLNAELGAVLGAERFLAEIRTTANLQHPHLLPLFDSGEADGLLYYVMPYVEGESLRARLEREKQLPVTEAVRIARAIAGALDSAHRQGIIHRDLKPENILLQDGEPLVADFGIALAVRNAGGNRITQTGLSLGTPMYMSPEQAMGDRAIDARADVYALGAITYEMLAGEPPHFAATAQAVIARVLTEPARPLRSVRATVPPAVEAAVARALEKLPADRFASAREYEQALVAEGPAATSAATAVAGGAAGTPRAIRVWQVAAALLALSTAGLLSRTLLMSTASPTAVSARLAIDLPEGLTLVGARGIALDRLGQQLAMVTADSLGRPSIAVRRIDDVALRRLAGTDSAAHPRFSPNGTRLAFLLPDGRLQVMAVEGGTPRTVTDKVGAFSWLDDEQFVVLRSMEALVQPASGGSARTAYTMSTARQEYGFLSISAIPGTARAVVSYYRNSASDDSISIGVLDVGAGTLRPTGVAGRSPRVSEGLLAFVDRGADVMAVPFDERTGRVQGEPRFVASGSTVGDIALSDNGLLVFVESSIRPSVPWHLYRVDRAGTERQLTRDLGFYKEPRVSPDGRRIVARNSASIEEGDLVVIDANSGSASPLTRDNGSIRAEWMPDGRQVLYLHREPKDSLTVRTRYVDRGGPDGLLARTTYNVGGGLNELAPAARGGTVAVRIGSSTENPDIGVAPLEAPGRYTRIDAASTSGLDIQPRLSPDGEWLAWASNESGQWEVYVTSARRRSARLNVSDGVGAEPMWHPSGRSLFYRSARHFIESTIDVSRMTVTRRDTLFVDRYHRYGWHQFYDVMPDGKSLVVGRRQVTGPDVRRTLRVVTNVRGLVAAAGGTRVP